MDLAALSEQRLALAGPAPKGPGDADVLRALATTLAHALDCETVILRLRGWSHQWASAQYGSTGLGCLLEQSLALVTVEHEGPLIASDATKHPLLKDHPLVASGTQVRAFAGIAAYATGDDASPEPIGMICALSARPRAFGPHCAALLDNMAVMMTALYEQRMELHRQAQVHTSLEQNRQAFQRLQRQFRQAERVGTMGAWRLSLEDRRVHWSDGVYAVHELPVGDDVPVAQTIEYYAPADRARVTACIERAMRTGEGFDFEADFVSAKGTTKRVLAMGEIEIEDGRPVALVGVFQDITDQHRLLLEVDYHANTDPLTGLSNRASFNEKLADAVQKSMETGQPLGVVLIDLDHFRGVNEGMGPAAGDELLCRASAILRSNWLNGSFAARLHGDEMVLLLNDTQQVTNLASTLERLARELAEPMDFNGRALPTGAALGASLLHPGGACSGVELLENADRALHAAKRDVQERIRIAPAVDCSDCNAVCYQNRTREQREERAA